MDNHKKLKCLLQKKDERKQVKCLMKWIKLIKFQNSVADIYIDIFTNIEKINQIEKEIKSKVDIFEKKEQEKKGWFLIYSKITSNPTNKYSINDLTYAILKMRANIKLQDLK